MAALEKNPAAVICLGDGAYLRSKDRKEFGIGAPVPQRKDGVQLWVRKSAFFWSCTHCCVRQGEDVVKSHTVQSVRVAVEQTFADVKKFKVMEGNKLDDVGNLEKLLDCVFSLNNLLVLMKNDPGFSLGPRRRVVPGEHVFKPVEKENDVDLKIPKDPPDLTKAEYRHIQRFKDALSSLQAAMLKAIELRGEQGVFFPSVIKRGENLYKGCYVLQLQVQEEAVESWTVKFHVGASYSYEIHRGYVLMTKANAVLESICDCYSGFVFSPSQIASF